MAEKGRILVIEANDITRKLIGGILTGHGYEVSEARDSASASVLLDGAAGIIFDADEAGPALSGLLYKIQRSHNSMIVVALSDREDKGTLIKTIGTRHAHVLEKPVMPDILLQCLAEHFHTSLAQASPQQEIFMRRAIDLSQQKMDENCGGPFGAVIVRDGKIISEGWNMVTSENDPTAHAEVTAIRKAAAALGDYKLEGCEIYTSCEPCPMCLAAIYWARIGRVYYANRREDAAVIGFDDEFLYREVAAPLEKRALPMKSILRDEAKIVFDNWVKKSDKTAY